MKLSAMELRLIGVGGIVFANRGGAAAPGKRRMSGAGSHLVGAAGGWRAAAGTGAGHAILSTIASAAFARLPGERGTVA